MKSIVVEFIVNLKKIKIIKVAKQKQVHLLKDISLSNLRSSIKLKIVIIERIKDKLVLKRKIIIQWQMTNKTIAKMTLLKNRQF